MPVSQHTESPRNSLLPNVLHYENQSTPLWRGQGLLGGESELARLGSEALLLLPQCGTDVRCVCVCVRMFTLLSCFMQTEAELSQSFSY